LNLKKIQNANVSRVSTEMKLLYNIPKVGNNTDGKATCENSINNAEFSKHNLFESQQNKHSSADPVGIRFV